MTGADDLSGGGPLLLIEREPGSLAAVAAAWPARRHCVLPLAASAMAPDLISREQVAMVVCGLGEDDRPSLSLLHEVHRVHPHLPVVVVVPADAYPLALAAFRAQAADVLFAPLAPEAVGGVLRRAEARSVAVSAATEQQRRAARSLDDLVLLRSIGATTGSEGQLQPLLDRIVATIHEALGVDIVSLLLCGDDGLLEIRAARGLPADLPEQVKVAPGEGVAGFVLASGTPVLIDDLASDGRFPPRGAPGRYRSGSLLSVPIRTAEQVIGVLNVNNKVGGAPFTAADQELLIMIAHQAALAIGNLKLVERLRSQSLVLERAHAELLQLHFERNRFVCNLSHELKTPLTSILGFADLLLNYFEQIGTDELCDYLRRIHGEGLHLERLIDGMLRLFSIDSGSESWRWEAVALAPCLDEVLAGHSLAIAELGLTVERTLAAGLAPVRADRDKLLLLLDALVDNAIKFNRPGGRVRIRAGNREEEGRPCVHLTIANDGHAVPADQAETIFREYAQLGDLEHDKPGGVGIGLPLCRAILRQMHGRISLEPVDGEGSRFAVLLPVPRDESEEDDDYDTDRN